MNKNAVLAGFAIFAMFFGSGNIVFPLSLGKAAMAAWPFGMGGFFLTAILVPLMGLFSIVVFRGESERFFEPLGKPLSLALQFFLLALIGPFGVGPRCINVAYGAFKSLLLPLPEMAFVFLSCLGLWFMVINQGRVIPLIGKFLTPFKLGALLVLVVLGLYWAPFHPSSSPEPFRALEIGVLSGYQTMDLMAAVFFGTAVMGYFKQTNGANTLVKDGITASLLGAFLLALSYLGLIYLGARYSALVQNVSPEEILPHIARYALGNAGNYIFSIAIIFACMTTAVALLSCWTDFVTKKLIRFSVPYPLILGLSLIATFFMSSLGFSGIVRFLSPFLRFIYPLLIFLSAFNLCRYGWTRHRESKPR